MEAVTEVMLSRVKWNKTKTVN